MRTQRILALSASVVFGVTLANANPVQAPGWVPTNDGVTTEQQAAASTAADGGEVLVAAPGWAESKGAASKTGRLQPPEFSAPDAAGMEAPAWDKIAEATAAGRQVASIAPMTAVDWAPAEAPAASAPAATTHVADSNPFVVVPTVMPPAALPGAAAANPFELPAAMAPQPAVSASLDPKAYDLQPASAASPAPTSVQPQGPDVRALRYYASEKDLVRVGAEIRRLKALYPSWQVPDDLFSPIGGVEEQPLWDLFALGNYSEIRRRIADMQVTHPQWRPSSDLMSKLEIGETKANIAKASEAGAWNQVIGYAATSKDVLVCTNMDALWSVGEALVKTSKLAEAFDLYRYVLSTCSDPHERVATFQKASLLLPAKGLDHLMPMAATLDEQASFANIRFDQLRGRMGAIASGEDDAEIDEDELQQFAQFIDSARSAADATLFGWYLYRLEYFEDSAAWFKAAAQVSKDPKALEGYILSLRNLDESDKAAEIAYKNRKKSPEINKVYVEIIAERLTDGDRDETADAIDAVTLKRFADAVDDSKSALGSQAIGWYYIDGKDLKSAEIWFDKSVEWEPTEGGIVGQAVIAARAKRTGELQKIKATYEDEFPALGEFKVWRPAKPYNKVKSTKKTPNKVAKAKPKSFLGKLFDS